MQKIAFIPIISQFVYIKKAQKNVHIYVGQRTRSGYIAIRVHKNCTQNMYMHYV